ncbi:MAG: hypothetical protein ACFFD2_16490 [Promethearchaeota archaeon]
MRSQSPFFLIIFSFFVILSSLLLQVGHAANFSPSSRAFQIECTTFYYISGEMCYDQQIGMFTGSYSVEGLLKATLTPKDPDTVEYNFWHLLINSEKDNILIDEEETGTLVDRAKPDGNYTPFFTDLPPSGPQFIHTLTETVEAHYLGMRYVNVNGHFVKTYYYCYIHAELQTIYRCEWFFEYETGILLQLSKSIEVNLIRVQWINYLVENTTISLTANHPISAFFSNQRANFFASVGAVIIVIFSFYYFIQKKVRRGKID